MTKISLLSIIKSTRGIMATDILKNSVKEKNQSFDQSFDFSNLVLNLMITGISYLAFPLIVCAIINGDNKKLTKKQITTITILNAVIVSSIFMVINYSNTGVASANYAAAGIWSFVAYFFMKKVCLIKEIDNNEEDAEDQHPKQTEFQKPKTQKTLNVQNRKNVSSTQNKIVAVNKKLRAGTPKVSSSCMNRIKISFIHKATTAFREIQNNVGNLDSDEFDEMLQPIRKLYEFLKKDETVSIEVSSFTFEEFYDAMLEIADFGFLYSKQKCLFIPVASLCFKEPISFVIDYLNGEILEFQLKSFLKEYFNKN